MPQGIVRKVDGVGRIVIPIEMRNALGITNNGEVEIFLEDGYVKIENCSTEQSCMSSEEMTYDSLISNIIRNVNDDYAITDKDEIVGLVRRLEDKLIRR